jgi:ADP-heptose:LPS heptosyltransferase
LNIDTMRWIDRFAGIPLCLLVSVASRFWNAIRSPTAGPLKRILFIELSETGSAILADPAMRKAQTQLGAEIYFLIFSANAAALDLLCTVPSSRVLTIRSDNFFNLVVDTVKFLRKARALEIDTVIDLECFSRYSGLLTGLSGADRRVGFHRFHNEGLYRGDMLTHRVAFNPHIHIAKNFIALVNALLFPELSSPYSKTVIADAETAPAKAVISASARTAMLGRIRDRSPSFDPEKNRLVLINPNASDLVPQRRWMLDRFAEVVERLLNEHEDAFVLITGASGEPQAAALAARCGSARCLDFSGSTALEELPALYALSSAMVTNDSGPGHFASVSEMPTVVLFGPETPRLYGPLGDKMHVIYKGLACSPCVGVNNHRKSPCGDNVCVKGISVDEVYGALCRILNDKHAPPLSYAAI